MKIQERWSRGSTPALPERIEKLSAKRQEIIRPILEHPRDYVLLSVRSMAKRLKTDPATIVRIVRGLDFGSYREFQHHLHELSLAFATPLDNLQASGHESTIPGAVRTAVAQDMKNMQGLKNSLDVRRLANLAKRLHSARRIVIFAGDAASILAEYLEYQISILGLSIFAATSAGGITHLARVVNKRDVVVAISFSQGLRQTVEGAQQARAHGAYTVGIADTYLSPLSRICDEIFLASIESVTIGVSYAAPICLLHAIVAACGQHRRPLTMAVAKDIAEERRKGFRWYNP
jgi:RpiR family carbohydrate utilization transcriptional regulator